MHDRRADVSEANLRREWRENHIRNIVCGGWLEGDDGKWQAKSC
jgi:hypothetical protein